jgi:hypothetical protein
MTLSLSVRFSLFGNSYSEKKLGLIVYLAVLLYSGGLAVYYLFIGLSNARLADT